MLAAGFETTVNLLGNGIRMLLDNPEHLRTLSQRPQLWPNAVEEILRLESPVQLTARIALNDTEVAGTSIKQGELVVVYVAAANRDPAVFADPNRFDIERDNAGQASGVLRWSAFLPGSGSGPSRRRGGAAGIFRPLPRRACCRRGQPP